MPPEKLTYKFTVLWGQTNCSRSLACRSRTTSGDWRCPRPERRRPRMPTCSLRLRERSSICSTCISRWSGTQLLGGGCTTTSADWPSVEKNSSSFVLCPDRFGMETLVSGVGEDDRAGGASLGKSGVCSFLQVV